MPTNMRVPSHMGHRFSEVPKAEIQRSQLDRSCGYKTTFDGGLLVPVFLDEILPGDTANLRMTAFARLATPIKPIMDNMFLESFFFFVPYRLVWDNWQKFNGEQENPGDSTDFVIPQVVAPSPGGFDHRSFYDYAGVPPEVPSLSVSALPWRAYALIWNEWFRDQNLQSSITFSKGDGPDTYGPGGGEFISRRGKRHDYFTSCLPWPQKGDSVLLPLGTQAPIIGLGTSSQNFAIAGAGSWETDNPVQQTYPFSRDISITTTYMRGSAATGGLPMVYADLTNATAASINDLRQAFQIQRLLERDARGGTRYTEILKSHFRVTSPDARLQRPEYLGGGSTPVNISPIAQTSVTDPSDPTLTPQGNLSAMGTVSVNGHGFVKSFVEHGIVIGLVSVRADLTYQQGLERWWSRQTRFDFYWPALAHIGEQAVLNKEIFAVGDAGVTDEQVFGYQERYAEYRYKPSLVTGDFRSNATAPLDVWHLAQDFSALPVLNSAFIADNPPIDRVIAVPTEPHFLFDAYFKYTMARPMPVFGVPGLIDHF